MRSRATLWWIIGMAAFGVRLAAALATGGLRQPELYEYDTLARNMIEGRGFVYEHLGVNYHSFAPPLYAWISAAGYWVSGSIVPTMLLQIAAGSVLAVIAAAIADRLFGGWIAGAAAGLLVAFHPGLVIYNATKAHPLAFDALFFTLALLQFFRLQERQTLRRAVELGVVVGVGTLSRATIIIFLPIGALWLLATAPRLSWPVAMRNVVVAGLCTAAVLTPWSIRNSFLYHRFVFILSTDGESFWRGNNASATGHSYIDARHIVLDSLSPVERADLEGQPDELAQSQWFMARADAFIRAHPLAFVRLTLLKFFHFWWFAPQTGIRYPRTWFWLYAAYYLGTLAFAALGVWTLARNRPDVMRHVLLIAVFLLALSALQSLYYVEGRHRWAVEPMLLSVSGCGVAAMAERWKAPRRAFSAAGS